MNVDLANVRRRLEPAFSAHAAREADHVYQFRIGGEAAFHLRVHAGALEVGEGQHPDPSVTFMFEDVDTALGVVTGTVDPMAAFMAGRIRTDGNLILALQLRLLFTA
ncbi:MAG: SCP2 sterol-binding domain-containing protein [Pseudomonadales bacterium]|nr:SCP2 sterol-binding domain-containing protein [Pseudomonadales bacterium]